MGLRPGQQRQRGSPATWPAGGNGVFPIDYCPARRDYDSGDLWLPTIESEDYILRGSWGNNGTVTMLVGEVLPQGNIFG